MADQAQQGGQGIDPAVADALKQHLQVATSMAKMGHDAMGAAHKQVVSTAGAHTDKIVGALSDAMQQGGGGGSQTEQAVWTAFPGTDPQVVAQLSQQGADPGKIMALFKQDEDKLQQMHQQNWEAHMNAHAAPQGAPEVPDAPPQLGAGLGG